MSKTKPYYTTLQTNRATDTPYLHSKDVDKDGEVSYVVFCAGFNSEVSFVDTYPKKSMAELGKIVKQIWKENGKQLVEKANSNKRDCDKCLVLSIPRG